MRAITAFKAKAVLSPAFTAADPEAVKRRVLEDAGRNAGSRAGTIACAAGPKLGFIREVGALQAAGGNRSGTKLGARASWTAAGIASRRPTALTPAGQPAAGCLARLAAFVLLTRLRHLAAKTPVLKSSRGLEHSRTLARAVPPLFP